MSAPQITTTVDLGHAFARIRRTLYVTSVHTEITLCSPAVSDDGNFTPAQSIDTYIKADAMPAFLAALQAEPVPPTPPPAPVLK